MAEEETKAPEPVQYTDREYLQDIAIVGHYSNLLDHLSKMYDLLTSKDGFNYFPMPNKDKHTGFTLWVKEKHNGVEVARPYGILMNPLIQLPETDFAQAAHDRATDAIFLGFRRMCTTMMGACRNLIDSLSEEISAKQKANEVIKEDKEPLESAE